MNLWTHPHTFFLCTISIYYFYTVPNAFLYIPCYNICHQTVGLMTYARISVLP